jgi:hypothetical protein
MQNPLLSTNSAVLTALLGSDVYHISEATSQLEQAGLIANEPTVAKHEIASEQVVIPSSEQALTTLHYNYLGENNKYILILIDQPLESEIIASKDLLLLEKTLAALKLELRDVAIVNLQQCEELHFKSLKEFFSCNKVLGFGIELAKIGIEKEVAINTVFRIEDCPFLLASSLEELSNNQAQKVIWWSAMKSIF